MSTGTLQTVSFSDEKLEMYTGYRSTDLGLIPDDWSIFEIGELSQFVTSGSRGWARFYSDNGSAFIRITNLSRESIYLDLSDLRLVALPPQASVEASRTQLEDGDLLISITADIGIIGFVDTSVPKPAYINQHIALVRFDRSLAASQFIAYSLASEKPQKLFKASMDVGAKAGMSLITVRKIRLALPPLPEQEAIAEALADVDALLAALDKLIAKKRAIKQAAMQQLLTGKIRLPGFTGEWETKRLGDNVTFLRNGVNSRAELTVEGSVKYLHYGDIHTTAHVRLNPAQTSMPSLPDERAHTLDRLRDGDLVFVDASEDLDGVGKSVEIEGVNGVEVVSGLHTIAARFDKSVLADGFKAYLQFCPAFRDSLRRLAAGTKVYATNRSHIESVEIQLPEVEEQIAIATIFTDMDTEITALEKRRDKTQQIKQGMMQQLLTGRIRLLNI